MSSNLYFRLLSYLRPYIGRFLAGTFCLLGASGCQLILPFIITIVTDDVLISKNMVMLNYVSVAVLVIFIVRGFLVYGQQYLMEYVAQRVVFDLREQMFEAMIRRRGLAYFEKNRTGGLMSYFTNDINALQGVIIGPGMDFVRESFVLVFSVAYMMALHWKLSLLLFISMPIIAVIVRRLGGRIKRASRKVLGQLHEFTAILQETLSGIRQVKSFTREDFEIDKFTRQMNRNFRATMKATRAGAVLTPIVEFMATIGVVAIIWYGSREVIEGQLSTGELLAFMTLAINLSNPIKRVTRAYGKLQAAQAACERVFGAMTFEPEVKDTPEAETLPEIQGRVVFDHVTFAYDPEGRPVIDDLCFTVEPGQMVALVGHSGAGKTTLANLVMRFYDVDSGRLTIDGRDVRSVTQESLREQIGIVPQETMLFSGSILENIRYGRLSATNEEVLEAARAAHVVEFAEDFPDKFDTTVGERGMSLSGGQRQRVAIARAVLKDPRILILDEATSALDTESEKLVQDALDRLLRGRTSFVIAHRLSTIFKADVIMVLDHGRLAEHGRHKELIERGGLYSRLYHTQFRDDLPGRV